MPVSVGYLGLTVKNHQHTSAVGDGGALTNNTVYVDRVLRGYLIMGLVMG